MSYPALILVDTNSAVVSAWRQVFQGVNGVSVKHGSILTVRASAWVTPTNGAGTMSGGVDAVMKSHFGSVIQTRVKRAITTQFGGLLRVGNAVCVPTGHTWPRYLISTASMVGTADNVSDTMNVVLACAAALQAASEMNAILPGSVTSIAIPGLGTGTGRVSPELCAELMLAAVQLFERRTFGSFEEVRAALTEQLGELGPSNLAEAQAARTARQAQASASWLGGSP